MVTRELKRFQIKYGSIFEPLAIVFLLGLYIIPILAVINLTPRVRQSLTEGKSVLGVQETTAVQVTPITGVHSVITNEEFDRPLDNRYIYSARLIERDAGKYSKPIIKLKNSTQVEQTVEFISSRSNSSTTELGVIYDEVAYTLVESDGEIFSRRTNLAPNEEKTVYIRIVNSSRMNFSERVVVELIVSDNRPDSTE